MMARSARAVFVLVVFAFAGCAGDPGLPPSHQLVDDALATVEDLQRRADTQPAFTNLLREARGIAIFPGLYKAGFIVGAEGGNGVMLTRRENGEWSYPAFYTLASGSFGLQFGGQRARAALVIRRRSAITAIVDHKAKLGVDVGMAFAHMGAGLEGATTTNVGADIVVFSDAVGAYAGLSLEGAGFVPRNDYNRGYYGRELTPRAILIDFQASNPQADALRAALARAER